MNKTTVFLLLILILGSFLRFYKLGWSPVGLHRDEAFLGYNAYSILKTGKDMNGITMPLHIKSFLYSPAGYSYTSIPFIALFGLNAFSVRFASALIGTLTIIIAFFLTQELFRSSRPASHISLLASLLLAISPWHLNLSRTATENTLAVFFVSLGVLLYLLWYKNKIHIMLLVSFASFFFTLIIYQAPRAFLPLFIPVLLLFYRAKSRLPYVFFFLTILFPLFFIFRSPALSLRLQTVSLFSTQETQLQIDEVLREDGVTLQPRIITRIFHNKIIGYSQQFLQNYFAHFSYPFLFTDKGLPDRYRIPNQGLLYLIELPFLLIGLYTLIKTRASYSRLLLAWIFLAPIGSALAFDDVPNLQRTLLIFPALSITVALGLIAWLNWLTKVKNSFVLLFIYSIISLLFIFNVTAYLHAYYIHQPVHRPWSRHEGYQDLVSRVNTLLPKYQRVIVTDRQSAPTIFFLFFSAYDPEKFHNDTRSSTFPDYDRIAFANYEFSQEECPLQQNKNSGGNTGKPGILYVNFGTCKPVEGTKELEAIHRGDSSIVFRILKVN
ncbi:glycosyltransferase family 39 protein [Candidatus Gottesmanbacteria bacterium]|nr:glycosyltransferase family 39 protein [Candidatus Gottesmanbacteria bacterium]